MDEILIGEKKYISSKQAAKVTGYAKDYIGQLCREGRVPARLVGRSWYMLESAIHDHRFGSPEHTPAKEAESISSPHPTWEAPRYKASEAETLPSVNRLRDKDSAELTHDADGNPEVAQHLQDAWQAWFDRFDTAATAAASNSERSEKPALPDSEVPEDAAQEKIEIERSREMQIPIRAIHHRHYQPSPEDPLPRRAGARTQQEQEEPDSMFRGREGRESGTRAIRAMQLVGVLFAILVASMAVLGSGYLDEYILSNSQVRIIAGVSLYNK